MELTRRDAIQAIIVGGMASGGSLVLGESGDWMKFRQSEPGLSEVDFRTIQALADTIYPTEIATTANYIETYYGSIGADRERSVSRAVTALNTFTQTKYGSAFHEMTPPRRRVALRSLGVTRAISRENGKAVEEIRYHLVNSLLYALFTTPTGSRLVGIQNPVGYPGGYESLLQPPTE